MARRPSTSAKQATPAKPATQASHGTGRYVFCPGSGVAHDQVFLEILQGQKVRFIRCPILACGVKTFLRGTAWLAPDVGFSRADAREANPNASIF